MYKNYWHKNACTEGLYDFDLTEKNWMSKLFAILDFVKIFILLSLKLQPSIHFFPDGKSFGWIKKPPFMSAD